MGSPSTSPHIEHARVPTPESPSSSGCLQCPSSRSGEARNLVVCIDGTSNQFGQNNTNVVKLFEMINLESDNPKQLAYYSSGIGTRPESIYSFSSIKRAISEKLEMAVAWNIDEIVKDAYGWLARTYQEGDKIYLFGFSRGAYQVRVLAGMMREVGLLRTPTEKQIGTAYAHYEAMRSRNPKGEQIARKFKNMFSRTNVRAHFVGVWDSVSSVGLIRGDIFLSCATHACHFRHALALDERRVKFIPEYLHKLNSPTQLEEKSKFVTSTNDRRESTVSGYAADVSEGKQQPSDSREVWFPGSHSDVGGMDRPGQTHQAGNVSLLWMRREAAANGLVLHPTDIVWVPADLDFGVSNSMTRAWPLFEYMPIKHQVFFSSTATDAQRFHRMKPRRILPGQKVHASVLYANTYKPRATPGVGFEIRNINSGLEDTELDNQIWETGLFDDTAALKLVTCLGSKQMVAPIYLDRLLFMLRFKEGKEWVRNVPDWQMHLRNVIDHDCAPLVRLVTIVAYYEASCNLDTHPTNLAQPQTDFSLDIDILFNDAKEFLHQILAVHKHPDGPRVIALLRPLTKHQVLRERILTHDVLETFAQLLDTIVRQPGGNFGQVMDGLNCLLQCEDTRQTFIQKLGENLPRSNLSRLSRILKVDDPHLQAAALRTVLTLARIPEARDVCSVVKSRLGKLARKDARLVGPLAAEILLVLYDPNDRQQLNIRHGHVRANLASALVPLNAQRRGSAVAQGRSVDHRQQILCRLFGLDSQELNEQQKKLIGVLKKAVQKGNARERTAATMTILKLCETVTIRTYLNGINLLDVFVGQLKCKKSALLAAYALVTCLEYSDMENIIKNNKDLPKRIADMLRQDYFDDAVGQVEGFQIFGDFVQDAVLRRRILENYKITEVLTKRLGNGKAKEVRTSLVSLEIFRSLDPDGTWTDDLVKGSLSYLQNPVWKDQKAGVTILSALALTKHGVAAIKPHIEQIVKMLLPRGYLLVLPSSPQATPANPTSPSEGETQLAVAASPACMLGPACALRILARNEELRHTIRETMQYGSLKHLYLSGTLVNETDTPPWRVKTPNRADVINMLDKMIKVIDEEVSEEGLMPIGNAVLPHIQHWNRLVMVLSNRALGLITILPALLGVSALAVLGAMAFMPFYLCSSAYALLTHPRRSHDQEHELQAPSEH